MVFKALGEATVYQESGLPLDRFTSQRRLVGLLSVLTMAGDAGMTRDKLAGLFWPDYPPERARHSLTQALYAARKASGCDDLFFVSETIRLNLEYITADVREFEQALDAGDAERAAELYRGQFLDGFYLPSNEFDNWLVHERIRLEDRGVSALSQVVDALEATGELTRAVEQARRLAAIRPTDASIAKRLMRLLAQAGDRAAAVVHANTFAVLVRERFEVEPDPDVQALADEIRALPQAAPEVSAAAAIAVATAEPDATPEAPLLAAAPELVARTSRRAARAVAIYRTRLLIAAAIIVVVASALFLARPFRKKPVPTAAQPALVIAPFRVTAADERLQYLADGMIELLSARFADDTSAHSVDAAALIRAWHQAGISGTRVVSSDSVLLVARRLGAERLITGSVVGSPERIIVNASVVNARTGGVVSKAAVEGSTDSLTALVDDVARKLLVTQINAQDELADRTTMSLPALRSYIDGSAAFAERDYVIAFRAYEHAVDLDTAFALAALKLGMTAARIGEFDRERLALDRAWRARQNLSEPDRAHLIALLGPRYPALSTMHESLDAWTRAARLLPDRPDVWNGLANASYEAIQAGLDVDTESVIASLRRAIALDSEFAAPRTLLARMQSSTYVDVPDKLARAGPAALRRLLLTSQFAGRQYPDALQAVAQLESKATDADDAMNLLMAEHSLLLLKGDQAGALEVTQKMQRLSPATRAHVRLRILDAIYANPEDPRASATAAQLTSALHDATDAPADACVLAQWRLAANDVDGARAIVDELAGAAYYPVVAGVHPTVCRELLQAGIAVQVQARDASARLQHLDSLNFVSLAAGDAAAYANIAIASWHLAVNEPERALAAIRRRPYSGMVWPRYQATSARLEAEIAKLVQRPGP